MPLFQNKFSMQNLSYEIKTSLICMKNEPVGGTCFHMSNDFAHTCFDMEAKGIIIFEEANFCHPVNSSLHSSLYSGQQLIKPV